MKTNLSNSTMIVCVALTLLLSACGAIAPAPTATALPSATATNTELPTFTPTVTLTPTKTPKPTATPNLAATQQYEDFFAVVQKIHEAGQISTTDGTYSKLDDYSDELAMSYGYSWDPTGASAKSFIVRADFDWEVANKKNYSGCGYMFRQDRNDPSLYYIIALDGINGVLLSFTEWSGNSSGVLNNYPAQLIKKMSTPDI